MIPEPRTGSSHSPDPHHANSFGTDGFGADAYGGDLFWVSPHAVDPTAFDVTGLDWPGHDSPGLDATGLDVTESAPTGLASMWRDLSGPDHPDTPAAVHESGAVVVTTPVPPSVQVARRLLCAVLDTAHPSDRPAGVVVSEAQARVDAQAWAVRMAAAEALAVLDDVTPPYPPLPARLDPVDPPVAVREALVALRSAFDEVFTARDLTRIGLAAMVLRRGADA